MPSDPDFPMQFQPPHPLEEGAPSDPSAEGDRSGPGEPIARSAGAISLATLISRIVGFARDVLIARAFGAGLAADAFFVAFAIPSLFRRLFTEGTLTSAFIPVYTDVRAQGGERAARRFTGAVALSLAAALAVVCALGVIFAEPLVRVLAPGFSRSAQKLALTAHLTRVMFPFLFFISLWAVAAGVLNAARRFFLPALTPAFQNAAMIAALLAAGAFAAGKAAVYWLAWGVVIGGALQLVLQLPLLARLRVFPLPAVPWRPPGVGRCLTLMGPAALSAAILQVNVLIDRWLASFLAEGSISYLYYANRLVQFPHGILSLAVTAAAFPVLSDRAAEGRRAGTVADAGRGTLAEAGRLTLFITLPAALGLIALARPIMEVLFERGAFGPAQTAASAAALRAYAIGLVFFGVVRLLAATFHARLDTRFPMRCANAAVVANVVLSVALMFPFGYVGLALATSLASGLNAALLIRGMRAVGGEWPGKELGRAARQLLPVAAAMGAAVYLANQALWPAQASSPVRAMFLLAEILLAAGGYVWLCGIFAPGGSVSWRELLGRRAKGPGRGERGR